MAIPPPPRLYSACSPEEKIRRCQGAYVRGDMTLEQFEKRVEEALLEEKDENDLARIPVA